MTVDSQSEILQSAANTPQFRQLAVFGTLSTCLYGGIAYFSWRFDYETVGTERPILLVILLFAANFALYLLAIRSACRGPQNSSLLKLIVWFSLGFRVVLLFSIPIQEIDIYRYLWDGAVTTAGVSPFRYSPEQVRTANAYSPQENELHQLVLLRDSQPALAEILHRVHFGELPTIYPPTSQAVFAAATVTTPRTASVTVRVFILKAWLIAFDLATLLIVIKLLRLAQRPVGLSVIYGWCPLLMKEVANSGHLDAIAVFLTTLAIYLTARLVVEKPPAGERNLKIHWRAVWMSLVLGLAIGAKLYPVILAPLLFLATTKAIGWRNVLIPGSLFVGIVLLVLWPMFPQEQTVAVEAQEPTPNGVLPPSPSPEVPTADPSLGVKTFLRRWEMNDFLFLVIVENLKPHPGQQTNPEPWFSILPQSIRRSIVNTVEAAFAIDRSEIPFLTTRAFTAGVFLLIASWLCWRVMRRGDVRSLCEASFLTIAWFWLLCPTQNPWYWIWALPMLPFARNRAWLALSGLVLLYYLRFWFSYHWPDSPVWGTRYVGHAFFDFVVTWIEFAPWFAWLFMETLWRNRAVLNPSGTDA